MSVIEASEAGGNANATTSWVGGVIPGGADSVVLGEKSGSITLNVSLEWLSVEAKATYKGTLKQAAATIFAINGKNAAGYAWRWLGGTYTRTEAANEVKFFNSTAATYKFVFGGQALPLLRVTGLSNTIVLSFEDAFLANELKQEGGKILSNAATWELTGGYVCNSVKTKILNLEGSTVKLAGTGTVWSVTAVVTLETTTSVIEMTDQSVTTKTIKMGELTGYGAILFAPTGGAKLKIEESFTCVQFGYVAGLFGATKKLVFKEGITMTVTELALKRTLAGAILESSVAGKFFTIKSAVAGTVFQTETLSIKDSHATNGSFYVVSGGTNVSGNEGWKFEAVPSHEHTLTASQPQKATRTETIERTLTASQAQSAARRAELARELSAIQAQKAYRRAEPARALAASQAQAATHSETLARTITVAQPQAPAMARSASRALSASQPQAITHSEAVARTLSATQAQVASRATALARTLAASQAESATATSSTASVRTLSASQGQSVVHVAALARALAASQAQSATRVDSPSRVLSAQGSQAASRGADITRTLSVTQVASSLRGSIGIARALTTTQAQEATVLRTHAFSAAFSASQGQSATVPASVSRTLSAGQSHAATLGRTLTRTLSASETQGASSHAAGTRTLTAIQHTAALLRRSPSTSLLALTGSSAKLTRDPTTTLLVSQPQGATVVGVLQETGAPGRLTSTVSWAALTSDVATGVRSSTSSAILTSTTEGEGASSIATLLIESTVE